MTVSIFPSSYGPYTVIRAELACVPETNAEGVATQRVITFETADFGGDKGQPVSVISATLFKRPDGHSFSASYDGQRQTLSRHQARQQYKARLAEGFSPDTARLF